MDLRPLIKAFKGSVAIWRLLLADLGPPIEAFKGSIVIGRLLLNYQRELSILL